MLKTPLKVIHWVGYSIVLDAENLQVATMNGDGHEEQAQEMVQRCNAHHKLLEACKEAHDLLDDRTDTYPEPCEDVAMLSTMLTLEQAIALVEGESSGTAQPACEGGKA